MTLSLQHIHLRSKDKVALAHWYCTELGFQWIEDLEKRGEKDGPILITPDHGLTGLSIFQSSKEPNNVFPAFGAKLEDFFIFYRKFSNPRIYDHYHFVSFYLRDLDQNKIEICCMDYEAVKNYMVTHQIECVLMTPETYTP